MYGYVYNVLYNTYICTHLYCILVQYWYTHSIIQYVRMYSYCCTCSFVSLLKTCVCL